MKEFLFRENSGKTTLDLLNWSFKSRPYQSQRKILRLSTNSLFALESAYLTASRIVPSFKTSEVIPKLSSVIQVRLYDRFLLFFCSLHFVFFICCFISISSVIILRQSVSFDLFDVGSCILKLFRFEVDAWLDALFWWNRGGHETRNVAVKGNQKGESYKSLVILFWGSFCMFRC